jgi:hypothetical protein
MSELTPTEKVASLLNEYDDSSDWYAESLGGWITTKTDGNTIQVKVIRRADNGEEIADAVQHFRAVVVEGTETPIVLERPAEPGLCWDEDGGDLILPIASGLRMWPPSSDWFDMTPAEARELAAHLAAMADDWEADQKAGLWHEPAAEASQAVQKGGQS